MNDETVISFAIDRSSRSRYREGLLISKKRKKLLDKLNHCAPLDVRYTKWFSSFTKAVDTINVKANSKVYILSDSVEIDGKHMAYEDAISEVPSHGWGTIICISSSLALYYGECGESAAVIRKNDKGV